LEAVGQFANQCAQAYWRLRAPLESERLALPAEQREGLIHELTATTWTLTVTGKKVIEVKADIKAKFGGRSPDFADALAIAVTTDGTVVFSGEACVAAV
jgi:hypothetical protein